MDANVLIFERFKEEIASGKLLRLAVQSGFKRAFVTIFDANMTVIITSCILFFLGSATVKRLCVFIGSWRGSFYVYRYYGQPYFADASD